MRFYNMSRYRKASVVLVSIGWIFLFILVYHLFQPLVVIYENPTTHTIPLDIAVYISIIAIGIMTPVLYALASVFAPLIWATLEVFDREH